jgi:RHS repeat-associated protein
VLDGGQATYNANIGVKQQFTGQQRDEETGLDYFWARNFQAALGRFCSVDPAGAGAKAEDPQSWNAYAYARNSPLLRIDRDGRDDECVWDGDENRLTCPDPATVDPADIRTYDEARRSALRSTDTLNLVYLDEPWTTARFAKQLSDLVYAGDLLDCDALAIFAEQASWRLDTSAFVESFNIFLPPSDVDDHVALFSGFTNFWGGGVEISGSSDWVRLQAQGSGTSGYRTEYRQNYNPVINANAPGVGTGSDQAHHFAFFFMAGYNSRGDLIPTIAAILMDLGYDRGNIGDFNLSLAAARIGAGVRNGTIATGAVSQEITKLCN